MVQKTRIILKKIAGVLLVLLGLAALFTPLTPGSWLIFIGAELLGIRMLSKEKIFSWRQRLKEKYRKKF